MKLPEKLSWEQAAATPICFATAWQMTVALAGARVIATAASDAKLERARAMGTDATIAYGTQSSAAEVRRLTDAKGADLVIESVGGEVPAESLEAVRHGGRVVTCGAHAGEQVSLDVIRLFRKQVTLQGNHYAPRR